MAIVLETTVGDMTIDLYTDKRPNCCKNFLKLCKMKYYNFSLFHTIQSNFIAQTGDPTDSGNGGESVFWFAKGPEAKYIPGDKVPKLKHDRPGLISMVNCGDRLIGSQFFITLGSDLDSLDQHIVFGEVAEGHDVLLKLNDAICDLQDRPYKDIRISHTVILEDPYEEIEGLIIPPCSPEPTEEILKSSRIAADEDLDDESKCSKTELREIQAAHEAKAQATILEIVGDIPDIDCAPPENVLFVCKLNPVTTDEDLQIIFGRFGSIVGCEVIRDKESGDSLQYAFIEFDNQKSCEDAYLKMDNVLIDDRRIHVDFSQSVAKLKWRGKGRGVEHLDKDSGRGKDKDYSERRRNDSRRDDRNRDHREERSRNSRHEESRYENRGHREERSKNYRHDRFSYSDRNHRDDRSRNYRHEESSRKDRNHREDRSRNSRREESGRRSRSKERQRSRSKNRNR